MRQPIPPTSPAQTNTRTSRITIQSPQRHANADLTRTARDRINHNPIQSDHRRNVARKPNTADRLAIKRSTNNEFEI